MLTQASPPFCFLGDVAVTSRLVKGPITDLNVMTRRGRWSHKVTRLSLAGPEMIERDGGRDAPLVAFARALRLTGKDASATLDIDDAALFEGAFEMRLEPGLGRCDRLPRGAKV